MPVAAMTIGKSDDVNLYAAYVELTYTTGGGGTTHNRTVSNNLALFDHEGGVQVGATIFLSVNYLRALSNLLGFSEANSRVLQAVHSRQPVDMLALSRSLALLSVSHRVIGDNLATSDSILRTFQQVLSRTIVDPFAFTDLQVRVVDLDRMVSNSLGLGDQRQLNSRLLRLLADNFGWTTDQKRRTIAARWLADSLAQGDALAFKIAWRRRISDAAGLEDSSARDASILRRFAESLAFADDAARVVHALRALMDIAGIRDDHALRRILGNVVPGDTTLAVRGPGDVAIEPLGPGATPSATYGPGDVTIRTKDSDD